ncbi:MAG: hypothetical protein PSX80_11475 [bacterium]|nr:hypothetical protein [bacterium]
MTYTYNASGAMVEQQYPSDRVVKNTYDAVDGSISQVQSKRSAETYRNFAHGFVYNSAGAVSSMRLGNGKRENTVFNPRLAADADRDWEWCELEGSVEARIQLRLDTEQWKRVEPDDHVSGCARPFVQNYIYDSLNRLESAEEKRSGWSNCTSRPCLHRISRKRC